MSSFGGAKGFGKPQLGVGLDGVEAAGTQHGTIKRRTDSDGAADMDIEPGRSGLGPGAMGSSHMSGSAANLSRKKAVPPQPAKKLVIKPFKGEVVTLFGSSAGLWQVCLKVHLSRAKCLVLAAFPFATALKNDASIVSTATVLTIPALNAVMCSICLAESHGCMSLFFWAHFFPKRP